jgi:hypothetical protein
MAKKKEKNYQEWIPFDLKPDKNFKMAKETKSMLALMPFRNQEDRNSFKRAMINAQLAEEAAKRTSIKRDKEDVSA